MPAYNAAATIMEAVSCVRAQTFTHWELIVVDDGSGDSTVEKVSGLQDSRVKLVRIVHQGRMRARNIGARQARGRFLAFLDADDLWSEDKLQSQIRLAEESGAPVVYSWVDFIDARGRVMQQGCHPDCRGDVCRPLLMRNFLDCGSNLLVEKNFFEESGGFDESVATLNEWILGVKLARQYSFEVVARVQVYYRRRHRQLDEIRLLEKDYQRVFDAFYRESPEDWRLDRWQSRKNFYLYLGGIVRRHCSGAGRRMLFVKYTVMFGFYMMMSAAAGWFRRN